MLSTRIMLWFLFLVCSQEVDATWMPSKVLAFFKVKNVFILDVALCSEEDTLLLMRSAMTFPGLLRTISEFKYDHLRHRLGIFIDLKCTFTQGLLNRIDKKWFTPQFTWLVSGPEDVVLDSFFEIPFSTFSEVFRLDSNRLIRLYKGNYALPMTQIDEGVWCSERETFRLNNTNPIIDLKNSPIRAGIVFVQDIYNRTMIPEQMEDKNYKPGMDVGNRFMFTYVQNAMAMYNLTFESIVAETWGEKLANGQWTGLMGLLERNEVDLLTTPMVLTSERMEVALPLIPTMPYWMVAVFKQPRSLTTYRAMILELTPIAWATFSFTIFLGAVVFALTEKRNRRSKYDKSFVLGCLQAIGITANQGLSETPLTVSSRVASFTMMMGCLLVSMYYGAGTMGALLTKSPPFIKTLEQMIESGIAVSAINTPYINLSQARSRLFRPPMAKRLGEKIQLFKTCDEGILSILNGSAFVGEDYYVYNSINKKVKSNIICDLTTFPAGAKTKLLNYVKDKHVRELFHRTMLRSMESGVMRKEKDFWLISVLQCSPVAEFIHVPLSSITVAVVIFAIGLILSSTTLGFELYFEQRLKQQQKFELASLRRAKGTIVRRKGTRKSKHVRHSFWEFFFFK